MKNIFIQKLLIVGFILVALWSCEKDDICAASTATTPHVIFLFYDINNPEESKPARQLSVRGFDENDAELGEIIASVNTDSIVLPLPFQEGTTTARFKMEKDRDFALDSLSATNSNIDIITLTYTPEFVYVSQACGYKSIFTNLSINVEPDAENWIISSEILNTTVENETQAHIILRH